MDLREEDFKLRKYKLQEFMFVLDLEFDAEGNPVIFTGGNKQGKGSGMKGVPFLLGGAKFEPEIPGRDGGKYSALVEIAGKTVRLIATRESKRGLRITVDPPEKRWGTDQKMLGDLIGKLAFDPMRFIQIGATEKVRVAKQKEMLAEIGAITEDLDALEDRIKAIEGYGSLQGERAQAKERWKAKQAQAAAVMVQPDLPAEKIDVDALKARRNEIREHNRRAAERIRERAELGGRLGTAERAWQENENFIEKVTDEIGGAEAEIQARQAMPAAVTEIRDGLDVLIEKGHRISLNFSEPNFMLEQAHTRIVRYLSEFAEGTANLKKQLEQRRKAMQAAQQQAGRLRADLEAAQVAIEQAPEIERQDDLTIDQEIDQGELTNREIDRRSRRQALDGEAEAARAEWDALGEELTQTKKRITDAFTNAKMPVAGMIFTEEGARYADPERPGAKAILLEDLSTSLQIEIGIQLALAGNPPLRLAMIDNGEALDKKHRLEMFELAKKLKCDIWMSCVDMSEEEEQAIAEVSPVTVAHMEAGKAKKISKRKPASAAKGEK